ncbi:terminase large subunit [Clostridium perfringens]|nr:terminase large subunit [Clostridium perfringens]
MILLDKAIRYAENVLSSEEITTWEVEAQCKIFLDDYNNRQFDDEFEFVLDEKKLLQINNILKLMNFATGYVEGKQVLENLADFQCFFLANIFGWRYKDNRNKFRYREGTLFIARKNAKTALIAIVFILLMLTEQQYSEFYSICLTKELASEIKKAMSQIINASPLLKSRFKISQTKTGAIKCLITGSFFEPRVAEAGKNNSIRAAAFVSDEHANFKENSNFNAMKSGQRNVLNPLLFRTTTAYEIDDSIMIEDLEYIRKVFNGVVENKRMFALIYYAYEENLWNDIGMMQANPLRIEENYQLIREDREKAMVKPDEEGEYLTKSMNHFLPSLTTEAYIDIKDVKKCELKEDFSLKGKTVYMSLDLSQSDDNTSVTASFEEDGEIYTKSWAFIPKNKIALKSRREKVSYAQFIKQSVCFACGENSIDYGFVKNFILNFEEKYECTIAAIGYDIRDAKLFALQLEEEGFDTIEIRQHSSVLHAPTKYLKELIEDNKWHYFDNKLLEINLSNARCTEDTNLNKYVTKKKSSGKVDMVVSTIMTVLLIQQEEETWDCM